MVSHYTCCSVAGRHSNIKNHNKGRYFHLVISNGHDKNMFHCISKQLCTSSQLFAPSPLLHPLPSAPIRAKGSCGDSSCMAEERVIKRRRPKEEVKGPSELLPHKRTHRVLGTERFSQGGSAWSVFYRPEPAPHSVCSLSPHHRPMLTPHVLPSLYRMSPSKKSRPLTL